MKKIPGMILTLCLALCFATAALAERMAFPEMGISVELPEGMSGLQKTTEDVELAEGSTGVAAMIADDLENPTLMIVLSDITNPAFADIDFLNMPEGERQAVIEQLAIPTDTVTFTSYPDQGMVLGLDEDGRVYYVLYQIEDSILVDAMIRQDFTALTDADFEIYYDILDSVEYLDEASQAATPEQSVAPQSVFGPVPADEN